LWPGYATQLCRRCNSCVSPFMGAARLTGLPVVPSKLACSHVVVGAASCCARGSQSWGHTWHLELGKPGAPCTLQHVAVTPTSPLPPHAMGQGCQSYRLCETSDVRFISPTCDAQQLQQSLTAGLRPCAPKLSLQRLSDLLLFNPHCSYFAAWQPAYIAIHSQCWSVFAFLVKAHKVEHYWQHNYQSKP
jgi:hypothetical protein